MKKILVWETVGMVAGGQRMTLTVMDMLKDEYEFHCLVPTSGALTDELDKRGIGYTLLGDQSMPLGIKGISAYFRYARLSVKAIICGVKACIAEKADMIYAPGPASLPWSAVTGILTGRRVVWHLHHIFLDGPTKKLLNFFGRRRVVTDIITVSESVGTQIAEGRGADKVVTLYNPVDVEKFSSGDPEKVPSELSVEKTGKTVITQIGLVTPLKRQDITIRTAAQLLGRGTDVLVLFAGSIREEDKPYAESLRSLAKESGISERVFFLGQRDDIPDILACSDIVIVPSSEGLPLAGLEAAASGTPVLGVDFGGVSELIRKSGAGEVFCEGDETDAADAVMRMTDAKHREKYSADGRSFAAKCSLANYSREIHRVFDGNGRTNRE